MARTTSLWSKTMVLVGFFTGTDYCRPSVVRVLCDSLAKLLIIFLRNMVARDGVEPPTPAFSVRSSSLTIFSINNLTCQDGRFIVTIL